MPQKWKRIGMALFGVIVTGFCVGAFQKADLGADPFTCFVTGVAGLFHSKYSVFYLVITGMLLIAVFVVERHYIGIATVFNLFGVGVAADFMGRIFWMPGFWSRLWQFGRELWHLEFWELVLRRLCTLQQIWGCLHMMQYL